MYKLAISCIFLFFFLSAFSVNAAIYQYIDSNGNITYSDKPVKGSKKLKETQSPASPRSAPQSFATRSSSSPKQVMPSSQLKKKDKAKAKRYTSIRVVSPKNDQGVRGNNGDVEITLSLKPKLQTAFGHQIELFLDGKKMPSKWQSDVILLKEVDRGTHTLSVAVTDKSGKKLKQSKVTTFHLLRHSILMSR